MSGQDVEDRDGVSVWCYDGSCNVCDADWCEHHCHHGVDAKVRKDADFAARGVAAMGLAAWSVIGAWQTVDGMDWPGLVEWSVKFLAAVLLWAAGGFVVRGLVGFKKEEGEK